MPGRCFGRQYVEENAEHLADFSMFSSMAADEIRTLLAKVLE